MLSFLSRFVGVWLIAAALIVSVVDGAKSIAASGLVLTPLAESWATIAALGGGGSPGDAAAASSAPWPVGLIAPWLATAPTAAVLAVLGFVFLAAGRRRRSPYRGREFAA